MEEKIVIGIDPGTCCTGYALLSKKNSRLRVIDFGTIRPLKTALLQERYWNIFTSIEGLVQKYSPQTMALETQFLGKNTRNGNSVLKLCMAYATASLVAAKYNLLLMNYAPREVKSAVVGNGGASKSQVSAMLKHILGLKEIPAPEDAADALGLAFCCLQRMASSFILEKPQTTERITHV